MTLPWAAIATGTQMAALVVWLCISIRFVPSIIRLVKRNGNPWDRAGAFAMITGLVFLGYLMRWAYLGPRVVADMPLIKWWIVANIASITLGIGSLYGFETVEVTRANVRARAGVLVWFAVVIACILLAYCIE